MKFKIVIIGAGRVAYSIVPSLIKSGYSVSSIISKNKKSAEALAGKYRINNFSSKLSDIPKSVNMFLLTVPDDQVEIVAKDLSRQKISFKNSFVLHFSGLKNINSLKVLKNKGARTASLHLMQAFPSKRAVSIKNIPAAIEAINRNDFKILENLAMSLNLSPFKIESKYKSYYHIAGVFFLNFLAGNLYNAKQLLALNNIDELEYLKNLGSTISSMIKSISKNGSAIALSGPVERGDIKAINHHIKGLKKLCNKSDGEYYNTMLRNYIVQSLNLLYLVDEKHNHLNDSHLDIKNILEKELKILNESK